MVFQSYALYPHMTVRQNMSFGLENIGTARAEIESKVNAAAKLLRLDALLDRRPTQLSGGQRQRVAIGRAIVREPRIFLFDEPLSNLDAELRVSMRSEITSLHERLAATMVYVTHDQVEAMTMADKIVVLRAGRIEQMGTPLDLYNKPANKFVAGFIGSPQMNFVPVSVASVDGADISLRLPGGGMIVTVAARCRRWRPGRHWFWASVRSTCESWKASTRAPCRCVWNRSSTSAATASCTVLWAMSTVRAPRRMSMVRRPYAPAPRSRSRCRRRPATCSQRTRPGLVV